LSRSQGAEADAPRPDLLRAPVIGRFLRWRHARTVLQSACLVLAALIILDGLFGPQIAPRNLAGTLPWVHWRGLVVLALLVVGNLFCMACPFMLPRRIAKRFGPARLNWPAPLRSKWLAAGVLVVFFWAYEAFSLWASPWLTAWVALTYFALAFTIDAFFKGASFCRHLCPIGQFHFVNSMVSPTEVSVRDPSVCAACDTLDCIRGRYDPARARGAVRVSTRGTEPIEGDAAGEAPIELDSADGTPRLRPADAASGRALGREGLIQGGCELALFQPRKVGNGDCTFCLECIHACPHDNVGILLRSPARELTLDTVRSGTGRLSRRPDWAALAILLTFAAWVNAFGMVEPVYRLQAWISSVLGGAPRQAVLAVYFLSGLIVLPVVVTTMTAWVSRALSGSDDDLRDQISAYAWTLVPVGFAMWTAHYLYHFLIGGLTIVPVVQEYLSDLGLAPDGVPRWGMGALVPESWLVPIEVVVLQFGLLLSLVVGFRIARRAEPDGRRALRAFLPWGALAMVLTVLGIWLLTQPMEMRGTFEAL